MIFLLVLGLMMVCVEVFIPGGIVGTLGGLALIGCVILAFVNQGTTFGLYWLSGVMVITLIGLFLSIKFLPNSPAGRRLFLSSSEKGYSAAESGLTDLLGKTGPALTNLRPAGMADIAGSRIDVVTGGEYLKKGTQIKIIRVEGNRVLVEEQKAEHRTSNVEHRTSNGA